MSQLTLNGEKINIEEQRQLKDSKLTPAELKIWNFVNSMQRGYTHEQIKSLLRSTGIQVFDNKLRSMRSKGWIQSWKGPDGVLLYYAVKPEEI